MAAAHTPAVDCRLFKLTHSCRANEPLLKSELLRDAYNFQIRSDLNQLQSICYLGTILFPQVVGWVPFEAPSFVISLKKSFFDDHLFLDEKFHAHQICPTISVVIRCAPDDIRSLHFDRNIRIPPVYLYTPIFFPLEHISKPNKLTKLDQTQPNIYIFLQWV